MHDIRNAAVSLLCPSRRRDQLAQCDLWRMALQRACDYASTETPGDSDGSQRSVWRNLVVGKLSDVGGGRTGRRISGPLYTDVPASR